MTRSWFIFSFLWVAIPVFAQQPLELDEAIRAMKSNNTQLKIRDSEVELANAALTATKSGFLPKVTVSHTGFYTNDPLNAFGFQLQQRTVSQEDFNPVLLNNPDGLFHFNTKLSAQHPILNFDIFSARAAAKEKLKAVEYQRQFAQAHLEVEIKNTYTNLQFLYEARKAVEQGISAYQETLRNTENLEKQGYAKPADVLLVEVGLTEVQNRQIEIDNNIANLSDYLSWLMGKDAQTIYEPTQPLTQNTLPHPVQQFSEQRADILAMKKVIEARNSLVAMNKRGFLPRVNAFGEFNYFDNDITSFGANSYLAGISLSWDIFKGNEIRNKVYTERINVGKAEKELQLYIEKNELEFQKAQRELTTNQSRIDLAETARQQAEESLKIIENRHAQGLEKTADLLVYQAKELEKQVALLEAIKDYNLSTFQIEFLTQEHTHE